MMRRWLQSVISILIIGMGLASPAQAQESVVPDLTGLSIPAAAAQLNAVGLRLGTQQALPLGADPSQAGRVASQSLAPGDLTAAGVTVDLQVYREPNMSVIFDDNDLTLVNRSQNLLDLNGLSFQAQDGTGASFAAVRWSGVLRPSQCTQVWSVGRNGPKGLDECSTIQNWLVTTQPGEHFWLQGNFSVVQQGVERGRCTIAVPGRCDFYLEVGGTGGETVEYIYFAYTSDRLIVHNPSTDQWMNVNGFTLFNNYPDNRGFPLTLSDATLYSYRDGVIQAGLLAPGQCISFTNSQPQSESTPEPCRIVASLDIDPGLIFWGAAFEFVSSADNQRRSCPAARPDQMTVCIMPR
jgi:hypothetical protein